MLSAERMKIKLQLQNWDRYNDYLLSELDVLKLPAKERSEIGSYDERRVRTKGFIWKRSFDIAFMSSRDLSRIYAKTE